MTLKTINDLLNLKSFTVDESIIADAPMLELFDIAFKKRTLDLTTTAPVIDHKEQEITLAGSVSIVNSGTPDKLVTVVLVFKYPAGFTNDDPLDKDSFKRAIIVLPDNWKFLDFFPEFAPKISGMLLEVSTLNATKIVIATDDGQDDQNFEFKKGLTFTTDIVFSSPQTYFEFKELVIHGHVKPRGSQAGQGLEFSASKGLAFDAEVSFLGGSILNLEKCNFTGQIVLRTIKDDKGGEIQYPLFEIKTSQALQDPIVLDESQDFKLNQASLTVGNIVMQEGETVDSTEMLFWVAISGETSLNGISAQATARFPLARDPLIEVSVKVGGDDVDEPSSGKLLTMAGADDVTSEVVPDPVVGALSFIVDPTDKKIFSIKLEVSTDVDWKLITDVLAVEKINTAWSIYYPFQPSSRQYTGQLGGILNIGGKPEDGGGRLQVNANLPDGDVSAWLMKGDQIKVIKLLKHLKPDLNTPDAMDKLAVTALNLKANPKDKSFHFDGRLDNIWQVETGLGKFGIDTVMLSADIVRDDYAFQFGGIFTFADSKFIVLVKNSNNMWAFSAGLAPDSTIEISKLINQVFKFDLGEEFGLSKISIQELWLEFGTAATEDAEKKSFYNFRGTAAWSLTLPGLNKKFDFLAGLEISKKAGEDNIEGKIFGSVFVEITETIDLRIAVAYQFKDKNNVLLIGVSVGKFTLEAELNKSATETILTLDTSKSSLTFGDILTFMAGLIDPEFGEFTFEAPWDELTSKKLPGLVFKINLTKKTVTATVKFSDPINILDVVKITEFEATYDSAIKTDGKDGFSLSLTMTYPTNEKVGRTIKKWDPINEKSPDSPFPSKSAFELDYLGFGQHIAFSETALSDIASKNPGQYLKVEDIVEVLRKAVVNENSDKILVYRRDSDWLIGAKFSLLKMLDMSLIFNDPVLYGLLVELSGEKAKKFAGLRFEILYHRITDTIGVYHTELTLPDEMRHFNIGAVAVTLPIIVLDIYSNGDFAVDVGFPWKGDWSRSALAEAGAFTGAGGFYFAKLSGATATGLPVIANNGYFGLVLKFGLALRLGLGRSFERGPLKAEFSVTIQGIFEGVLAWYHYPVESSKSDTELYHRLQASVQLVGRLYGSVDFVVIQIEVEVIVYAGIQLTIEAYKAIQVVLVAGVSVKASIKILFIKIHFSFELTLHETFTIGTDDDANAPWYKSYGTLSVQTAAVQSFMGPAALAFEVPPPALLPWDTTFKVWPKDPTHMLEVYFQPAFTKGMAGDEKAPEVKGIALLFIENAIPANTESHQEYNKSLSSDELNKATATGLSLLTQAMLAWALQKHPEESITLDYLNQHHDGFSKNIFTFDNLIKFLSANFIFKITYHSAGQEKNATVFPMFPQLTLLGSDGKTILADFNTKNKKSVPDLQTLLTYYAGLKFGGESPNTNDGSPTLMAAAQAPQVSMATFIFVDYFAMLTRSALKSAIEFMRENGKVKDSDTISVQDLLSGLISSGKINHLAGMLSRFMLYGLRLPFGDTGPFSVDTKTHPLYELTGQQFTVPTTDEALKNYSLTLKRTSDNSWLKFDNILNSPLKVNLNQDQKNFIKGLADPKLIFTPQFKEISSLPFYQLVPRHFSFNHKQDFDDQGIDGLIWSLPATLVSRLTGLSKTENGTPSELGLKVSTGSPTESGKSALEITPLNGYEWGTLVEFTIRRLPTADGSDFLKNTYLVTGIGGRDTNSSSEDYLEELIATQIKNPSSKLLYEKDNKLQAPAEAKFHLLRTNRAGGNGESLFVGADQTAAGDLARILWETGKNAGGTYLHFAVDSESTGLPEAIFDSSGIAILRLLIIERGDAVKAGRRHNCLITGNKPDPKKEQDFQNVSLFAETTDDNERVKTRLIKPGHVGFRIVRQPIALNPSDNTWSDELDNLFQLLRYRLLPPSSGLTTPDFSGSLWGMPVGPAVDLGDPENPDDDLWAYERVIPVYRFANKPADGNDGLPPASENPYAGIVKDASVGIEFEFLDVYGNRTTSAKPKPVNGVLPADEETALPPMTLQVKYFDNLLGLKSWPGAVLSYAVDSGVQLILSLQLNPESFLDKDLKAHEKKLRLDNAVETYRQIYYQVHQADLRFKLTTSLDTSPADGTPVIHELDKSIFTNFVGQAYKCFVKLLNDPKAPLPDVVEIKIPLEGSLPKDLIFPVMVEIKIQRDAGLIHADSADVEAVKHVVTAVAPFRSLDKDGNPDPAAMRKFAEEFEKAIPSLKLMSGNVDDNFGQPASLWAVRWSLNDQDPGIYYKIDAAEKAVYFAPAPLSNRLLSHEVALKSIDADKGLVDANRSQRFDGVDLDAWGREFLTAVDAFLEADLSVPAYVNPDTKNSVQSILTSKSKLADAIAKQVRPILLGSTISADDQKTAEEVFKQEVLEHLENTYTIETIVQLGVDIELNGNPIGGISPRLSGKPLPSTVGGEPDYTISTAKIPLTPDRSNLTFLYNTPAPEKESQPKINVSYHINALEFNIENLKGLDGYQDSSWLTFILPPEASNIEQLEIPVPLRVFPTPPSLIMQRAEADTDSLESLDHIREWQYTFIYEHLDAAQDAIEMNPHYNLESSVTTTASTGSQNQLSLLAALANFRILYPQVLADLNLLKGKMDGDSLTKVKTAANIFAQLVSNVAKAWAKVTPPESGDTDTDFFEVKPTALDSRNPTVTIKLNSFSDSAIPKVYLPGYKDPISSSTVSPVTYSYLPKTEEEAQLEPSYGVPNIPDFRVSIDNRDIVEHQSAWAEIWVSRNRDLGDQLTHPAFIYRTPGVHFGNRLIPLLVNTKEWHIDEKTQQQTLFNHLEQLFKILLPPKATRDYDLHLSCRYAFALAEGDEGKPDLLVPLPVILGPRLNVPADEEILGKTATFKENLNNFASAITEWFHDNQPARQKAAFIFNVAILSSESDLPLLQIDDLRLSLENITDLQPSKTLSI